LLLLVVPNSEGPCLIVESFSAQLHGNYCYNVFVYLDGTQ
jgi:hypothetical protein